MGSSPVTESIESGLESGDTREKTEHQAKEDPAESVDDASAFGFELNFYDDTLTAANESQIQIRAFQVLQQKSREKMKNFPRP